MYAVRSATYKSEFWGISRYVRRMSTMGVNPYESLRKRLGNTPKQYFALRELNDPRLLELPYSIRVLLESAVRNCDEYSTTREHVENILGWCETSAKQTEIPFIPARVLLQDFTYVFFSVQSFSAEAYRRSSTWLPCVSLWQNPEKIQRPSTLWCLWIWSSIIPSKWTLAVTRRRWNWTRTLRWVVTPSVSGSLSGELNRSRTR